MHQIPENRQLRVSGWIKIKTDQSLISIRYQGATKTCARKRDLDNTHGEGGKKFRIVFTFRIAGLPLTYRVLQ